MSVPCPHCRSTYTTRNTQGTAFFGTPKIWLTCLKCGHQWRPGWDWGCASCATGCAKFIILVVVLIGFVVWWNWPRNHPRDPPTQPPAKPTFEPTPPPPSPPASVARPESGRHSSTVAEETKKLGEDSRWRTWTTSDGKHTVEAKFVNVIDDAVYLERRDGKVLKITTDKLCEDDLQWIKTHGLGR